MIREITWNEIHSIWSKYLWPNRVSAIEPISAMTYLGGIDILNFSHQPVFLGYVRDSQIIGVNSGHVCSDNGFRSRGLWVDPNHRGLGIGQALLIETITEGIKAGSDYVWSYPRQTSWKTYKSVGFRLTSDWQESETSDNNAYCYLKL